MEVLEGDEGEVVGVKFVDLCLEEGTKIIHYTMYLERHNNYFRIGYDGWEGEWWIVLKVSKAVNNFFQ